jgi:hypothetical protein
MQARAKVLLTPLGNRIKYQVIGRIVCSRMRTALPNSRTWSKDDLAWIAVFGSEREVAGFSRGTDECRKFSTFNSWDMNHVTI